MRTVAGAIVLALLIVGAPPADGASPPDVPARSWVVMDAADGEVLAGRAAGRRVAMASITKLMTARVAAAQGLDRTIEVPAAAATVGEASAGLEPGAEYTIRDLVEMALIPSGNDAAVALAAGTSDSTAAFVRRMNAEARSLGLTATRYANPHGLDATGHRSSALDSARLLRATLEDPELRTIIGTREVATPAGTRPSTNLLLGTYAGVDGGKTGMTDDAGWCTVVTATRGRERLIVAVLGAESEEERLRAARRLLDWGFSEYRTVTVLGTTTPIARVPTATGTTVALRPARAVTVPIRGDERPTVEVITPRAARLPIAAGDAVGVARIAVAGRVLSTVPLVSTRSVAAPEPTSLARRILDLIPSP